jgi:hypothetical protein
MRVPPDPGPVLLRVTAGTILLAMALIPEPGVVQEPGGNERGERHRLAKHLRHVEPAPKLDAIQGRRVSQFDFQRTGT